MKHHRSARGRPRIALLIETSLGSGRDILRGVTHYIRDHSPWALYVEARGLEESIPSWLRQWRGDGIIARIQSHAMADAILASGIPTVDVLGVVPGLPLPLVHVDNDAIARMALKHFVERRFRRFGFFGIAGENWSQQRYEAFCAALGRQETIAAQDREVSLYELPREATGTTSWERLENRLARWVSSLSKPAGILVCSDQRGPQLLEACRRAAVSVPEEIAVIGVDNDEPLCEACDPPLSSIEAGHEKVGYNAAGLLDGILNGVAAPKLLLVQPEQVVARTSTDRIAISDGVVAAALRLIRERAHEGLSVGTIARHAGLSSSALQRRFREALNRSVHQEVLATKIQRALELIRKTELSLAVVAERAGFNHQEYMGAVFKTRLGKTPAQLRQDTHGR
jgi:LacI family transcriptional regulator